ncbi:hypothetical protein DCC81_16500 [Chitinophaga parva]|uniref:DUF2306 domain-containing protein n=1 Tax=Chitinophaga parva TaxID=2169414 RepID=A0A2T7BHX8_9BACT|nr:DUF2306 domain-containing protein [Chitinophaga parva]PUZ25853.1 hypothetical protein DCC81_16500 [Chitinophaga parva]
MLALTQNSREVAPVKALQWAARAWFIVFFLGQVIFACYIFLLYWRSAFQGHFENWNAQAPHLYVEGAGLRNAVFALHIATAAIVSLLGPLQLLPKLRQLAPRFHRISGRFYIFFAFAIAIDGLLLAWRKGAVGGNIDHIIISINALIILTCAYYTIRYAINRELSTHQRWAVHLVLGMSGVWLFRVFLMFWLVVNQGPVGFDPDTFTGPFLVVLSIVVYVFPQVAVWGYFKAQQANLAGPKWVASIALLCITLAMLIGVFAATMGMWWPRIQ